MRYDVIVIGGGHAGCEAAAAAARLGAAHLLLTHKLATIGEMSCNPAIGGLAKGHLVREIDALDGVMGRATDRAGIQFRMLNRSKGPAVRGPRAQADRKLYRGAMQSLLAEQPNLTSRGARSRICFSIRAAGWPAWSPPTAAHRRRARSCSTTGTFLRGLIHFGEEKIPAGRVGEAPSLGLSATLERAASRWAGSRPARRRGSTADHRLGRRSKCSRATTRRAPFSFLTERITTPQVACHITATTPATHALIRANLHRAPIYSGQIEGTGPRYCPSIEDKVVRFADRDRAPDLPRAGRARRRHGLSQRHLDLAAARRSGGAARHHPRPRACRMHPAGLCHRI